MSEAKHLEGLQSKAAKQKVSDSPAGDFMSKNPLLIADKTKIYSAIQALAAHKVGSAPVVNTQNKIVGVVSEHDLLLQTATKDVTDPIQYTKEPITVTPETPLKDVLILLYTKKVRRIPVIALDRTVLGIVTRMDVLSKLIGKDK